MAPAPKVELSEYERKRQETIAKNQALLRNLALDAASAGLGPGAKPSRSSPSSGSSKKKKPTVKKEKVEHIPVRKSSRLQGIVADSEVAKRKADDHAEALQAAERAKRQRISGDLKFNDIVVSGQNWDQNGNFLTGVGPARPYERTFDPENVKETSDKELRALREKMSGLELWEGWEPNRLKITPERVYSLGFHPTKDKALVFAGDKMGNLGIFDASQKTPEVKNEDDEDEDEPDPVITTLKPHTRTISTLQFSPHDSNTVITASYDSSIRKLDLAKGVSVVVYEPADSSEDAPISGIELVRNDPNLLYFTTLAGQFGIHDLRTPNKTEILNLSEKKIGGFSLHPQQPHLLATASLDRKLKLWDLRKFSGKGEDRLPALIGEHESRLSVSHASWNHAGQVATASYDDTVKIYDFSNCSEWKVGTSLTETLMKPATVIPHNNQTGRWVTILRAQWQLYPQDNIQRFVIGNMNRFVDVYTSKGEQLAQLGGDGITAVPAVAQFHQSQDWIAAGTASGKLCLWI